jgi:DNA (cytosine-5)-methyltransferase 1
VTPELVLSIFPGIGLLDHAFEEEGFTVVRGPDVLWGGDVRRFHPPAGVFGGVIGGPPCQAFSGLVRLVHANGHEVRFGNLIPEFERVVAEGAPSWFVMENVREAPEPSVPGYRVASRVVNNRWFGAEQDRERRISFGSADGRPLVYDVALFEPTGYVRTVTSNSGGRGKGQRSSSGKGFGPNGQGHRFRYPDACRYQGLPEDFLADAPFTAEGKLKAVANGVPLPMGRAIARAVRRAMGLPLREEAAS